MAASIEEITKDIVELPRHQRLALVRLLLDLDRPGTSDAMENAWDEEIRARSHRSGILGGGPTRI
jgi:hypothetical protein